MLRFRSRGLRFRVLGASFSILGASFSSLVLRFRILGASFSSFGCFVLRSSFSSASFSKLPSCDVFYLITLLMILAMTQVF